jgi:lipopolysaccharide/colanic/teichoic acid biosynthesis glycosyltransferase
VRTSTRYRVARLVRVVAQLVLLLLILVVFLAGMLLLSLDLSTPALRGH